ncbi:MAG: HEAT repeat domain-containing protein [Planctomycetes bacterium]|nr:HEAT repeat domain-containing protein [Planctomycetota bacterium]
MLQKQSILLGLCLLIAGTLVAQENAPTVESLWKTGSLWQVGENKQKVADARQAIIDRGDAGLEYAISKLAADGTLEIRCLRAVIGGFGEKAIAPLTENILNESTSARRNVADLLSRLDAKQSAEKLLEAVAAEESAGVKLAQLSALAKWKIEGALPYIRTLSNDPLDRIRHRTTSLLKAFDNEISAKRLIEMLDDDTFYVRDGARSALRTTDTGTRLCLNLSTTELAKPDGDQSISQLRRWMSVACASADSGVGKMLAGALKHKSALVRAEAANNITEHVKRYGHMPTAIDFAKEIKSALEAETDPFARSELIKASDSLKVEEE